jgi:uncharacterized repeat protein (TIGR01451 family)
MKHFYLLAMFAFVNLNAQIITIPDANFKNALVNTPCVILFGEVIGDADTNNDGEIQQSEAAAITALDVGNQNIASLSGIEYFTSLTGLDCSNNQLTALDVSAVANMVNLNCSHNLLTSLAANFNDQMFDDNSLDCSYNSFTSLTLPNDDFFSVSCNYNQLTQIDMPTGGSVHYLNLSGNPFVTYESPSWVDILYLHNCPNLTSCILRNGEVHANNNPQLVSAVFGSWGNYNAHSNPLLESISIKDGYAGTVESDWPMLGFNFTENPSLHYVCLDDLGQWYYEGEWFFQPEIEFVHVDPGVTLTYYCDYTGSGNYNTITGTIAIDANGGGCGVGDAAAENIKISLMQGMAIQGETFTNAAGGYTSYNPNASQTLIPQMTNPYFTISPPSYMATFSETVNFCISPNGTHNDLEVTIIPLTPPRPGFDAVYKVRYQNRGTETQSGTVSLAFEDGVTDFVISNPAVSSQAENLLSWDFASLSPFESRSITVTLNVNSPVEAPPVIIGDVLDFTASVAGATDETPLDNIFALAQTVVGSLDPNDKAVSKATIGTSELGEYLYYTVRFQNTGTFYAENVVVRDVLSENLEMFSLEVVATSHPCRTLVTRHNTTTQGNDKVEFFFEGINLPSEADNEPGSHGYATFRIKPKNNLVLNNTIENEAEIYFDFNAPIVTNTVTTTISALGLNHFNTRSFSLYPNPANHILTIEVDQLIPLDGISIFNVLGQLVKKLPDAFEDGKMTIDISDMEAGSYFVQVGSEKGNVTKKLVKF